MRKRTLHILSRYRLKLKGRLLAAFIFSIITSLNISAQCTSSDLQIVKTAQLITKTGKAEIGDTIKYDIKVTNLCGDTIHNVQVIDPLINLMLGPVKLYPFGQTTGSGSFCLTGSGSYVLQAMDISRRYVPNTATGSGTSMGNQLDNSGSTLTGFRALACKSGVNISLDGNCRSVITPKMLLTVVDYPDSTYEIVLYEMDGVTPRNEAILNGDDAGKTLKVAISVPGSPHLAYCWTYINVEFKLTPQIICSVDTLSCAEFVATRAPVIDVACGTFHLIEVETERIDLCALNPSGLFMAKVTTTYRIQDAFGNLSDPCQQVIYIKKANIVSEKADGNIVFPKDITLNCNPYIFTNTGAVSTTVSGVPTWDGVSLLQLNTKACNVFTEYEDRELFSTDCTKKIIRMWKVYEWKCTGGVDALTWPQEITIADTTAPKIVLASKSKLVSVDQVECLGEFIIPPAVLSDDCQKNEDITIEIRYKGGVLHTNGGTAKLDTGTHIVEYIARDKCFNESRDTMKVTVIDNTRPVAICIRNLTMSVPNGDTLAIVPAHIFNESSYDACGLDKIQVRRMSSPCNPQDTILGPNVSFCCADAGKEIPVILRVTDRKGNFSECMVMVRVADKSPAQVTGLPNLTVSCDFTFSDPRVFGWITKINERQVIQVPGQFIESYSGPLLDGFYVDNCGVSIRELPVTGKIDSICGTGQIKRTIEVIDASGKITKVEQFITFVGDQKNNPIKWKSFPKDTTITGGSADSIAKVSFPTIANVGCSQVGLGYRDSAFIFTTGPSCMKILRHWQAIDWCRSGAAIVLDSVQFIFVDDNTAPVISKSSISSNIVGPINNALISVTVKDNFTPGPDLFVSYLLRRGSTTVAQDTVVPSEFGVFNIIANLSVGQHILTTTARDICNNSSTRSDTINVTAAAQQSFFIQGEVATISTSMDKVNVYLSTNLNINNSESKLVTSNDGKYAFGQMPLGAKYYVIPYKNDDVLNGVSTLDLLLIQKHILGITKITDPTKLIAADINADNKISALDLAELRSVLLGKKTEFHNNESWRFAWKEQNISEVTELNYPLMEQYEIKSLDNNMKIDFKGIKTGDISGDAIGNSSLAGTRSFENVKIVTQGMRDNGNYSLSFIASNDMDLQTLQMDLQWAKARLISKLSTAIQLDETTSHALNPEMLSISWSDSDGKRIVKGTELFRLVFDTETEVGLHINRLKPELVQGNEIYNIELSRETFETEDFKLLQNNPNPWSDATEIVVESRTLGMIQLRIMDTQGRIVYAESKRNEGGVQKFRITSGMLKETGLYIYEVEVGGSIRRAKMIRLK